MEVKKEKKFILKCWDGDIYILTGYSSQEEIDQKLAGLEKARMPNGDIIKTSAIEKIQSFESYAFQADQRQRHKRGQYLRNGRWFDHTGYVTEAKLNSITGVLEEISLVKPKSTQKRLTRGR